VAEELCSFLQSGLEKFLHFRHFSLQITGYVDLCIPHVRYENHMLETLPKLA